MLGSIRKVRVIYLLLVVLTITGCSPRTFLKLSVTDPEVKDLGMMGGQLIPGGPVGDHLSTGQVWANEKGVYWQPINREGSSVIASFIPDQAALLHSKKGEVVSRGMYFLVDLNQDEEFTIEIGGAVRDRGALGPEVDFSLTVTATSLRLVDGDERLLLTERYSPGDPVLFHVLDRQRGFFRALLCVGSPCVIKEAVGQYPMEADTAPSIRMRMLKDSEDEMSPVEIATMRVADGSKCWRALEALEGGSIDIPGLMDCFLVDGSSPNFSATRDLLSNVQIDSVHY